MESQDQVSEEIQEEETDSQETDQADSSTDQSEEEQSEETEQPTLEKLAEALKGNEDVIRGLQKGYTITRQEMAEVRDNIKAIADSLNKTQGTLPGDDDYITESKLKDILRSTTEAQAQEQYAQKERAQRYIDDAINQLRIDGVVRTKGEEEDLMRYAVEKKEVDLFKAADRWQEVKQARLEGQRLSAKAKAKQGEGSKVGSSSKVSSESKGVNYEQIRNMDWSEL